MAINPALAGNGKSRSTAVRKFVNSAIRKGTKNRNDYVILCLFVAVPPL